MSTPSQFPPSMLVLAGALLVASGALATSCGESDKVDDVEDVNIDPPGLSFCCEIPDYPPQWMGDVVEGEPRLVQIGGRRRTPEEMRVPPGVNDWLREFTPDGCAVRTAETLPQYYEVRMDDGCPYWYPNTPPDAGDAGFN